MQMFNWAVIAPFSFFPPHGEEGGGRNDDLSSHHLTALQMNRQGINNEAVLCCSSTQLVATPPLPHSMLYNLCFDMIFVFVFVSKIDSIDGLYFITFKGIDQWEKRWVGSGSIRYPPKVFSLRFLKKSVQAPSCKRHKTTQRTLFLSFEINNWYSVGGY
jgi:hypothetical protein